MESFSAATTRAEERLAHREAEFASISQSARSRLSALETECARFEERDREQAAEVIRLRSLTDSLRSALASETRKNRRWEAILTPETTEPSPASRAETHAAQNVAPLAAPSAAMDAVAESCRSLSAEIDSVLEYQEFQESPLPPRLIPDA